MAILSTVNWLSEERLNISSMRRIESAVRNDFDETITSIITNTSQGYFIRGFNILTSGAIGAPANGLSLVVDPGAVLHIAASVSGTIFQTPTGTVNQVLNAATNTNVSGSFTANSTNYVGLDYNRFQDPSTDETVYIWDASSNSEITVIAPAAQTLTFKIYITTSVWGVNVLPIAIVKTDGNGNVVSITDARWMLYSLETGGINPNPNYVYPWSEGRTPPPVTTTSDSVDPFIGGDRSLTCLKDWMNAVMTQFLLIQGTPYWSSSLGGGGSGPTILSLLQDLGNTVITGSGEISNGILPNSDSILVTTGNITSGNNQLTNVPTVYGPPVLAVGDYIFGTGIPTNTTILSITPTYPTAGPYTITMSQEATLNGTGLGVTFYSPSVITQPGQINWDQPINIRVIGSSLMYTLAANPSSTNITLADDEVAYITLVNNVPITPNLIFVGGSPTVNSVGAVSWTSGLLPGDYIKVATDTVSGYYQIETINSLSQVTLTTNVSLSDNSGPGGSPAQYAFGSYTSSPSPSTNRDIYVVPRADVPANAFWLFLREDNGGSARVYIRFLAQELDYGESVNVSGTTSLELLQYIGSRSASDSSPQYVSALNPGSLPQITNISAGAGSTITGGQYFLINSSANARQYVVWFTVNGVGTAPVVPYTNALIQVPILSTDTASQVNTKIEIALNSTLAGDFNALVDANEYIFVTSPANATVGATYTNNGQTFTVVGTISGGTTLVTTGTGAPLLSGSSLLASASTYAVLGATAVTGSTGAGSILTGNLGIYPNNATSITNFPPSTYTGTENAGNTAAQIAQSDALSAYTSLAAHGGYVAISSTLDGQTLTAGYYSESSGTFHLASSGPGTLTLNGSSTDVFVFKAASTLTTGAGGIPTITLTGGALAQNVYWLVGSSATINSAYAGVFNGNIIAQASITDTLGGTVNGSLIALTGAVTLSNTTNANAIPGSGTGTLTLASGVGDPTITFTAFTSDASAVVVTNTSAGVSNAATNGNVGAPFAISIIQVGTGTGNYFIHDGDNLTLAIKELDLALGNLEASLNSPTYDETISIVTSGGTYPPSLISPVSINGPIANSTVITLPLNSREGNTLAQYTVGKGVLEVFLNGQFLDIESGAYSEVGAAGAPSNQIEILTLPGGGLVVGDELELRFGSGGGGGGGGQGAIGPTGPQGEPGVNGLGNMQAISTKVGPTTYSVLTTDQFILCNCSAGTVTLQLPLASSFAGRCFYAKKIDASPNYLFITTSGSDTIDGFSNQSTNTQYNEFSMVSSGGDWYLF